MTVYIVQHGKALTGEEDPRRPLSREGREEVERIAGVARGYNVGVSEILHSGKDRARQTAEIMKRCLQPAGGMRETEGLAPKDDLDAAMALIREKDRIMLVGHLPHLERLVSLLVAGNPDHPVFKLQNGGILCLGPLTPGDRFTIRWGLMPHVGG